VQEATSRDEFSTACWQDGVLEGDLNDKGQAFDVINMATVSDDILGPSGHWVVATVTFKSAMDTKKQA
jgi:hypothetical protein